MVDAKDFQGGWFEAVVLAVDRIADTIKVHFKGWNAQ